MRKMAEAIHYVVNIEIEKVSKNNIGTQVKRDVENEVRIVTTEKLRSAALKKAIKYLQIEETE
jgi:hypothetical protein